jgi:hypothetical protein
VRVPLKLQNSLILAHLRPLGGGKKLQPPPDEVLEPELDELVEDVPELLEDELLEELEPPLIVPAEAVSVTLSSRAPSSRLEIRSV